MRFLRRAPWIGAISTGFLLACGSRTGLHGGEGSTSNECNVDADCVSEDLCELLVCDAGSCRVDAKKECPSSDVCLDGACNSSTGECEFAWKTRDADRDGFTAALPGFVPGEPGSCGDDCDDTRAGAHPGGVEICDGVDNDCDGVVDNGSEYLSLSALPDWPVVTRLTAPEHTSSSRAGLVFGADQFVFSYWANDGDERSFLQGRRANGDVSISERRLTSVNAPSYGAELGFDGAAFGAVWSDTRAGNSYELYFTRFDAFGEKLSADVRLTTAAGFSVNQQMFFHRGRYVVLFDDDREGEPRVFAQLVGADGSLLGDNVALSALGTYAEYPSVAATERRFGVAYTTLDEDGSAPRVGLEFVTFDQELANASATVVLATSDVRSARVTALGDRFVVTWDRLLPGGAPDGSLYGAVLADDGTVLVSPRAVTTTAPHARSQGTLSLGDRFLFAWADDSSGSLELYGQVLDRNLGVVEPRRQLTQGGFESAQPVLAVSDRGRVVAAFDQYAPEHHAFYLNFGCQAPPDDCSTCSCADCPDCCIVK